MCTYIMYTFQNHYAHHFSPHSLHYITFHIWVLSHLNITNVLCLQWIEELQREILDDTVLVTAQFILVILNYFGDICHAFSSIPIYLHFG